MKDTNSSLFFLFPMWYGTLTARPFNLSPTFVEYVAGSSKKRMAGMWCVKSWNLTSLNPDLLYTANPESVKTVSNFFCFWSNIFRESTCKCENKEKLKEDSKIKKKKKRKKRSKRDCEFRLAKFNQNLNDWNANLNNLGFNIEIVEYVWDVK